VQACDQGNRKTILELLQYGARTEMNKFCRLETKHAQKVADELGMKALPIPGMLAMDRKTMTEIKSYSKPSPLVHLVMQAVFLLFDEDEEKTSVLIPFLYIYV
jgi:bifunctional DNase/RNase